ncbi:sulfurtransferase [Tumebacillus algifaecis]|uniref:Sulfurtransferase n=1 Tax=Tumebacillus algifaecis TaxID=1214604 RepID=A0A223D032_9BACL|nr:rhodanese-like domain-containing protein [Tumebacillus algifaecis]ASS75119.1 sulfurtransferase [Tumebacillus algifaecis]
MAKEIDGIRQMDAAELQELIAKLEQGKVKLIDVREPHEYTAGHIPGVPLIPMNYIPGKMTELNKEDEYVFICRSGNRSQQVARYLKMNGYDKVINFYGGMLSWAGPTKQGMEE